MWFKKLIRWIKGDSPDENEPAGPSVEPPIEEEPVESINLPEMNNQDRHTEIFPAEEPLVLLLTDFLSSRLNQLISDQHSDFNIPVVPDWKNSGFLLSENFSLFVDEINYRIKDWVASEEILAGDVKSMNGTRPKSKLSMACSSDEFLAARTRANATSKKLKNELSNDEKWILIISLVPHIYPHFYDEVIFNHLERPGDYPQLGFIRGKDVRGFYPTGETVFFLLAGNDFDRRIALQRVFQSDHLFAKMQILWLEELPKGDPVMSGKLILGQDHLDMIMFGEVIPPTFSMSFPAQKIETDHTWDDLVINNELEEQILTILSWVRFNEQLSARLGMRNKLRKGFRTLFCGPPGTGKTFTAGLIGTCTGKPVYRIDLSMVVSKYIGDTEKQLAQLFARAEHKGWILFFDEADAIFGKRTSVRDAHDKYANQEVSYLLQRIEDYNGLVILATNMKNNIDPGFIRRFSSILNFPFPDQTQRSLIWKNSLPQEAIFKEDKTAPDLGVKEEKLDIPGAVKKYELSGGNIVNVIHYAAIKAVETYHEKKLEMELAEAGVAAGIEDEAEMEQADQDKIIVYLSDILDGIRRELIKEGKPFPG